MAFNHLLDRIIFPPCCYLCSRLLSGQVRSHLRNICPQCLSSLPFRPKSNLPPPDDMPVLLEEERAPWKFGKISVQAIFYYEGAIREAILRLKFSGCTEYGRLLGALTGSVLKDRLRKSGSWPAGIVPIPLSEARLLRRGYNQADLLAKHLSEEIGVEVFPMVRRIKDTERQSEMRSREERQNNVNGAFELNPDFPVEAFRGREIILIDDVLTSGFTMQACAKPLQQAGLNLLGLAAASGSMNKRL